MARETDPRTDGDVIEQDKEKVGEEPLRGWSYSDNTSDDPTDEDPNNSKLIG
jgi:hypothetical protein